MGQMIQDSSWRIPDALWERMAPLLPPWPSHPLGCHNPRVPDRAALDGIFFVLRTGSQWAALSATGICSKSSVLRRFTEWVEAGVFDEFRRQGLLAYDGLAGIDWEWLSADGAMTKTTLGGKKNRPQSNGPRETGHQALGGDGRARGPHRRRRRWRQRARLEADSGNTRHYAGPAPESASTTINEPVPRQRLRL
jgi:transposase